MIVRILIADDEAPMRRLYAQVLEKASAGPHGPYDLVFCDQGEAAVAAAREAADNHDPFAMAFLDVRMPPGRGGLWAAEELRANVRGPLMLQFGSLDKRVNATWPDYEKTLKANGAEYVAYVYEDANHGFHNDTTPRYDEAAAELAWSRTIEFFKEHLMDDTD